MNWLLPSVAGTLLIVVTLFVSYLYTYRYVPSTAMRLWIMAWAYYTLRMVLTLSTIMLPGQLVLEFLKWVTAALSALYLLFGALEFGGIHRPVRDQYVAAALLTAWAAVSVFGLQSFLWTTIPIFALMGLANVASGYVIWRNQQERHLAGASMVSVAFVLWGLHKWDFPFLRHVVWFAPIGFWIGNILGLAVAVGTLVMVMAEGHQQLQDILEEKARLSQRFQEQARRLFAFSRSVARISIGMDQEALLQDIVTESMDVLNADRCALYLISDNTATITCPVSQGLSQKYIDGMLAQVGSTPGASLLKTAKPLLAADALQEPAYRPFYRLIEEEGFRGLALFPLHHRGRVIGALALYFDEPHIFADEEIETSMTFAHIVASVIEHSRTLAKERRRASELEALQEVSMHVSSSLDLLTVLKTVAKRARETIGATNTHLFAYDAETDSFTIGLSDWSPNASHPRQTITPRQNGLTATVAHTGTEIIISNMDDHPLYRDNLAHSWDVQSIAGFPIKLGDRVLGVLNAAFEEPHVFTESETRLLSMLAGNAAIAIENANLYREMADLNRTLEQRVQTRTKEIRTLMQLGQKLANVLSQEELVNVLMEAVHQLLTPDAVICLICPTPHRSVVTVHGHLHDETQLRMLDRLRGVFVSGGGQLAANAALTVFNILPEPSDSSPAPLQWPIPSQIYAPLRLHNHTIGQLCACGRSANTFKEEDERYLVAVALQASNALARLDALETRQRSRLQAILDSTPDGLLLLDEDGQVVVASPTAQEMISLLADLDTEGHVERLGDHPLAEIQQAVQNDGRFTTEVIVGMLPLIFDLQAHPVYEKGERLPGILVRIADVTRERRTQEQLFQASKLASVGELAAGVAHEINNPLTAVIGFSELLLNRVEDEENRHMLERIIAAGQRTRNIVQGLLQFSRGLQARELARDDINEVVRQTVNLLRRQIELEGIDVFEQYAHDLPWLNTDSGGVGQVILNLLQNARDAIHDSGIGTHITIHTEMDGPDYVAIVIEDDGPGISPDKISRIFDPFFTTKPPGKGTGLGLSISHRIASELGGNLSVRSEAGRETVFTLRLPISYSAPVVKDPAITQETDTGQPAGAGLTGRQILVIDDEPPALEVVQQVLESAGAHVTLFCDGQTALDYLLGESPRCDLILLDIKMPGITGIEVFKQLVNSRPAIARRVLFVTGDVISSDTAQFLQVSERPSVAKPFSRKELLGAIQNTLRTLARG